MFKLYKYYQKTDNSGLVGYAITFVIFLCLLVLNTFIFYNYIVFVHMDGRLSDIYVRIAGILKKLIIPYDNEVSFNYLRYIY